MFLQPTQHTLYMGKTNLTKHKIETGDNRPIKQYYRKIPVHLRNEVVKQTQDMLQQGIVEESISPWSSPVVFVKKKRWEPKLLCRLPETQCCDTQRCSPPPSG